MSDRLKKWSIGPWVHKEWGNLILDGHKGARQISVAHVSTNTYRDECRYNAYLIAAAPSLVEALEACISGEFATTDKEAINKAEAALAIAYGETK